MADGAGAAEAGAGPAFPTVARQGPTVRVRPWWFPAEELKEPLVFYLEAWLVDLIFGPDRAIIPKIEWMSQVLLTVDIMDSKDLGKITIFGRPSVQNRVKHVVLAVASWHRKRHHRISCSGKVHPILGDPFGREGGQDRTLESKKMEQLEEFLKASASGHQHLVA